MLDGWPSPFVIAMIFFGVVVYLVWNRGIQNAESDLHGERIAEEIEKQMKTPTRVGMTAQLPRRPTALVSLKVIRGAKR